VERCNGEIAPGRLLTSLGGEPAIVGFASVDTFAPIPAVRGAEIERRTQPIAALSASQ